MSSSLTTRKHISIKAPLPRSQVLPDTAAETDTERCVCVFAEAPRRHRCSPPPAHRLLPCSNPAFAVAAVVALLSSLVPLSLA